MTRNEQIDIASLDWWMNEVNQNGDAEMAFKAGAAWADAHPRWISVEDALEKQGEQPTDKVEPKFNVGDWITNGGANPCYVKSIFGDYYELCSCEGFEYTKPIKNVNYIYHLWTINDAKESDVLVDEDNNIGLLKEKDDLCWHSYIYLGCDNCLRGFNLGGYHTNKKTKPAAKEQRELLSSKMKEAGYEWDAEKKELKKIEHKMLDSDKVIAWLVGNIIDFEDYVRAFKKDFGL